MSGRIWIYFMTLTGLTLLFLWMLHFSLVRPYYERHRIDLLEQNLINIEKAIKSNQLDKNYSLTETLSREGICAAVYHRSAKKNLTEIFHSSPSCLLESVSDLALEEYMDLAERANNKTYSFKMSSVYNDQGMYLKVKNIHPGEFIFLFSPLDLTDSTISVLRKQYTVFAVIVFFVATLISFLLSKRLSKPIVDLTQSAQALAQGNFDAYFDTDSYDEIKILANSLNYATEEFRNTDQLRRDLVANVSHDYKTPLTMIKAYAEMIQDISGDDPQKRNDHLNIIIAEVNHLESLVDDTLTLSRIESNSFKIRPQSFNLKQHLKEVMALLNLEEWDLSFVCDDSIHVFADEAKVRQIFYNLLNNAMTHACNRKKIDVFACELKDKVRISIRDYGQGIPLENQKSIWDRYYQSESQVRDLNSSGLGLSIVSAIAKAHHIDYGLLESSKQGSTFYYELPLEI